MIRDKGTKGPKGPKGPKGQKGQEGLVEYQQKPLSENLPSWERNGIFGLIVPGVHFFIKPLID